MRRYTPVPTVKKVREEEDDPMYAGMLHKLRYVMNREYTGGAEEEGEEDVRRTSGLYVYAPYGLYAPWIIRHISHRAVHVLTRRISVYEECDPLEMGSSGRS